MYIEAVEQITNHISDELLKRGFTAKIQIAQSQLGRDKDTLLITSESFNTVPVIMKSITIDGRLWITNEGNGITSIRGRVGVTYQHFSGGQNGTDLFSFSCKVKEDYIFDIQTA